MKFFLAHHQPLHTYLNTQAYVKEFIVSVETEYLMSNALLATRITKSIDGELSMHGISFTEYLIMHHLSVSSLKTMRRIELADAVGISASGVTRLLAPMEKSGIVQKEINPRDARQSLVKLSGAGQRLYLETSDSFSHRAKRILDPLTGKQLEQLIELTGRL